MTQVDNLIQTHNPFFSVIVPVYNVRDYLEECVSSVCRQSFQDYELILVNDGSTDGSAELCDLLSQGHSRIHVIHQKNQGLSMARNNGLQVAKGKYILFLDSDDFYPQQDFMSKLWEQSKDRDLVCFNYARYTDKLLGKMIVYPEQSEDFSVLCMEMARNNAYQSSACIKAVKRSLLKENQIVFEPGTWCEDIEWSAKVLAAARDIAIAPECIYAYRVRPGSATQTVSPIFVEMQLRIVERMASCLPKGVDGFARACRSYVAFQYGTLMINGRLSKPGISRECLNKIRSLSWLLQYDDNRQVKLIHTVHRALGFECTSWLLLVYFRLFRK